MLSPRWLSVMPIQSRKARPTRPMTAKPPIIEPSMDRATVGSSLSKAWGLVKIAMPTALMIMMKPMMVATQGMTTNQPVLPMSCRRFTEMARFGQIRTRPIKPPMTGIQPVTTLTPSRISQLIQKCWRRRRPLNENMALAKS
ncbi:hypothetical protein D3C72_1903970 [compost metagenome]